MGLRTASVRHPHVEVMAPALTETTKIHFKLPSNLKNACPVEICAGNRYINHKKSCFPVNASKETSSVIKLNNESSCENLTNSTFKQLVTQTGINLTTADNMSSTQSLMCDQENKMGLQKTVLNLSSMNKQNIAKNMEQMLSNLGSISPESENVCSSNLGAHMDSSCVFKSMEDKSKSNSAANDVINDHEMFAAACTDLANNLTPFEKDLLENVDVMGIEMEDQQDGDIVYVQKESQAKDLLNEIEKKHIKIKRKLDFLRRRAHKLQSRLLSQHISYEISGVFENVYKLLKRPKDLSEINTSQLLPYEYIPEKVTPCSISSTKNLIRKLQKASVLQAHSLSRQKVYSKYFGSGSVEIPPLRNMSTGIINILPWPAREKCELDKITCQLKTQLSLSQREVDSEATDSSSGGESCDEMHSYNNPHQQYLSVQKRALWKYSNDRAVIAARWTWLQAQIADIEYRIRLHADLHKQIRTTKGAIKLEGPNSSTTSTVSPNATVNGFRGQLPGSSVFPTTLINTSTSDQSCQEYQCSRTMPLVDFKKRKLIQISNLHAISKRAARPSTMKCGCVPLSVPCALCTGRSDPTYPRDVPDILNRSEKIALLDPGFHPVFSLSEDTSQSIHLEAIMKTTEWQQRSSRMKTAKALTKLDTLESKSFDRSKRMEHRRKYGKLLRSSTISALSEKIKHKVRGRRPFKNSLNRIHGKRLSEKDESVSLNTFPPDTADDEIESISNNSNSGQRSFDSPNTSPLLQTQSIAGYNKKGRVDSYDIDNIVIPYSVAAATRVEKLQYKEILTPKWRIAEPSYESCSLFTNKNNGLRDFSSDSDGEDLTDDAVFTRHDKCEYEEKKRFLSYLKLPIGHGRNRSHKRTDSRAESSGANTPDRMSPHNIDQQDSMNSPMASPPATPLGIQVDENMPLPSIAVMRRRTMSQSKFLRDRELKEETMCNTADIIEVAPYEKRTFPISDEIYEKMLKNMPENHQFMTNSRSQDSSDHDEVYYLDNERTGSPDSESTESAIGDGEEDPNDPEWSDSERNNREKYKK